MIQIFDYVVTPTIFPDRTSQVWQLPYDVIEKLRYGNSVEVRWRFESEVEIMHLAQLRHLMSSIYEDDGGEDYGYFKLTISYLPYARQDKPVSNDTTFALHTFAKILNGMKWSKVNIIDPHSPIALELINNSNPISPCDKVQDTFKLVGADLVCYPDLGAVHRYVGRKTKKGTILPYVSAMKWRDQHTGEIIEITFEGQAQFVVGKTILIVDDICDGGATFIKLAHELLAHGAKEVHLFVTHGLFTKGVQVLHHAGIKRVFDYYDECTVSEKV